MALYVPSQKILTNYANLLVNFALGGGQGIKQGDTVQVIACSIAEPLFVEINNVIVAAGGNMISYFLPNNWDRFGANPTMMQNGSTEQVGFFPKNYFRGMMKDVDHSIYIIADEDPRIGMGIDPAMSALRDKSTKPLKDWRNAKEVAGEFSWNIALYGTPGMAKEAGMTVEEYWDQIIKACYLDVEDPISEWKHVFRELEKTTKYLNQISPRVDYLHMEGTDCDLKFSIGDSRKWLAGSGRNIPSFEVFTSPDWRTVNGWIRLNQPLYRYGQIAKDIYLKFEKGKVVDYSAQSGIELVEGILQTPGGDQVGEFSLTDGRLSRITRFMANTLFDENVGGPKGNTHIALGSAFKTAYHGDGKLLKKADWKNLGYNDSGTHVDVISTVDRVVTAYLKDGSTRVIYRDGQFIL